MTASTLSSGSSASENQSSSVSQLEFPNSRGFRQYTHRIFNRYPARSISLVPRFLLERLRASSKTKKQPLRVLDPFMGSGTTAVEAALQGMHAIGVELDPFARLVSEVSTRRYSRVGIQRLQEIANSIDTIWRHTSPVPELSPTLPNIERWFDSRTFDELLRVKTAIYATCETNRYDLNFFRVVLADMIRPCSKAERQSLKPYISTKYEKTTLEVGTAFQRSFLSHVTALEEFSAAVGAAHRNLTWSGHDATDFHVAEPVDIAITSPPYINALDYVRCIKLESVWAGCSDENSLRQIRLRQVGDQARRVAAISSAVQQAAGLFAKRVRSVDRVRSQVMLNYFEDMRRNLELTYDALRPQAEYHVIIGNSTIRGVDIPTHAVIAELASHVGFTLAGGYRYRIKDHRTSIPRNGCGGKILHEHVLSFRKE